MGTIRPINTSELTPHWDKILFGIELSLIGILFRQLPQNRKLWQHSRVSWSTRSASLFPPLQPDTPQWRAAGVFTQSHMRRSQNLTPPSCNIPHILKYIYATLLESPSPSQNVPPFKQQYAMLYASICDPPEYTPPSHNLPLLFRDYVRCLRIP